MLGTCCSQSSSTVSMMLNSNRRRASCLQYSCLCFIQVPTSFCLTELKLNLFSFTTPWSAPANILSVTRCNISCGAKGFRSAASAIWNSLPSNVCSCETLTTFHRHLKSLFFPFRLCCCQATHLSASDSFTTMMLYKFIYLLTYFCGIYQNSTAYIKL